MDQRWARVPIDAARVIPGVPARVFIALLCHRNESTGQCDPSVTTISSLTDVPRRSVLRALQQLRDVGLVDWDERPGTSSRYRFTRVKSDTGDESGTPVESDTGPVSNRTGSSDEVDTQTTNEQRLEQNDVVSNDKEETGSKLAQLGLRKRQIEEALRDHPVEARAWANAGPDGVPKTGINRPAAFILSSIRDGVMPVPESPKPRSTYMERQRLYGQDFTGCGSVLSDPSTPRISPNAKQTRHQQ